MSIWLLKKLREKENKKYLFEANSFQHYLVNRTKVRQQNDHFKEIKWKEKDFINKFNTPTINDIKMPDWGALIEMDCEDEVDLGYYQQFSKHKYYTNALNSTIAKSVPKPVPDTESAQKPSPKSNKSQTRKTKPI